MNSAPERANDGTEPSSMDSADAANGESPIDPHDKDEQHRTGERQARQNEADESPA